MLKQYLTGGKVLPPKGEARRTGAPLLVARATERQFDTGNSQRRFASTLAALMAELSETHIITTKVS